MAMHKDFCTFDLTTKNNDILKYQIVREYSSLVLPVYLIFHDRGNNSMIKNK